MPVHRRSSLLVAGTSSDAGKSVVTAGICRWLARQGVRVAPFKAQNMSNNSVVTADGGEIGRAQGVQALACGIAPEVAMNPVLLKPGSDRTSHVLLMGRPWAQASATSYADLKPALREASLAAFDDLASRFDVVVCEGAGSPAEINLRAGDLANMGLARARSIPTLLVADIDRGGMFASLFGTLALLEPADQALVAGYLVNRFRGDPAVLQPGLDMMTDLTGRRCHGILPWLPDLAFDAEDSLSARHDPPPAGPPLGRHTLRVAAVRLPRISNTTDVDALASEPGVLVRWTESPVEVAEADLVVLPGTRATVADLDWLHRTGLAAAIVGRAAENRPLLGICGGFQMLGSTITDTVESPSGTVAGLGLLDVSITFAPDKTVRTVSGTAYGHDVDTAYEIHHGVASSGAGTREFLGGVRTESVWGTHWHGALDSDDFRRAFLTEVAAVAGRDFVAAPDTSARQARSDRLDRLADLIADHADAAALFSLLESGAPAGLPVVPPAGPRMSAAVPRTTSQEQTMEVAQ